LALLFVEKFLERFWKLKDMFCGNCWNRQLFDFWCKQVFSRDFAKIAWM